MRRRIEARELRIQQLDVQSYFFRRTNTNALGQPRSWTDHLLWSHAAHTVALFACQTGSTIVEAHALQGHIHARAAMRRAPADRGRRAASYARSE